MTSLARAWFRQILKKLHHFLYNYHITNSKLLASLSRVERGSAVFSWGFLKACGPWIPSPMKALFYKSLHFTNINWAITLDEPSENYAGYVVSRPFSFRSASSLLSLFPASLINIHWTWGLTGMKMLIFCMIVKRNHMGLSAYSSISCSRTSGIRGRQHRPNTFPQRLPAKLKPIFDKVVSLQNQQAFWNGFCQ